MHRSVLPLAAGLLAVTATAALAAPRGTAPSVALVPLGTYASGAFDEGAAEIVAHDPGTQTVFVVNANAGTVDLIDIADPTAPALAGTVASALPGGSANSVAVAAGLVAVVVAADPATDPGVLALYSASDLVAGDTEPEVVLPVGANPDMVTFTPNGRTVLVANEGEPNEDYTIDPEGSVSLVDIRGPLSRLRPSDVRTATFDAFEGDALPDGVRVFGPGASVAQDLEPEYVTVTTDGRTAYVSLQENNAIGVLDIRTATFTDLLPLGTKDHSLPGNELDPSDRDGGIAIGSWPVRGLHQPDAIATTRFRGEDLIVTANEGDARDYDGFSEEVRVRDLPLCPDAFPAGIQANDQLGRLRVTDTLGMREGAGCYEELFSYGARSLSIFGADGRLLYDSGATYERTIAGLIEAGELPRAAFNATNDDNDSFDSRSDDKGPEPEGVVLGTVAGRTLAFVGLERVGGIMVHDITDPADVRLLDYVTTRDFSVAADDPGAGDLGPEGLVFVRAADSPTGRPMLVVGSEVSGTTTLFDVVLTR